MKCLSRFISRRGCPSTVLSDNGTNFTAEQTQHYASNKFIRWKFNIEGAPWFGGMWERLVSSVKTCIKKAVGVKRITYIELQTLIYEIEQILNNRPLGADYDDDTEDVLTRNHLIFGRRLEQSNNDTDTNHVSINALTKRQKVLQTVLNQFWNQWRRDYLTSLREYKSKSLSKGAKVIALNDIVIVYDHKLPRHMWKIGRVSKLIKGHDNKIRAAEILLGSTKNVIKRPINKLYPIMQNIEIDNRETVVNVPNIVPNSIVPKFVNDAEIAEIVIKNPNRE